MTERNRVIYVTADASDWLAIDVPFGLITPPTIELHQPLVGSVEFYHADSYRLTIPKEAQPAEPSDYAEVQSMADGDRHVIRETRDE
jgi:hypothetical protein